MQRFNHTAFINSRRDERGLGHHTLRAYSQDLRTFSRFTKANGLLRRNLFRCNDTRVTNFAGRRGANRYILF